jgi:hypothetical protein
VLSLHLSRACLGKIFVFIHKWHRKKWRFSHRLRHSHRRCRRRLSISTSSTSPRLKQHTPSPDTDIKITTRARTPGQLPDSLLPGWRCCACPVSVKSALNSGKERQNTCAYIYESCPFIYKWFWVCGGGAYQPGVCQSSSSSSPPLLAAALALRSVREFPMNPIAFCSRRRRLGSARDAQHSQQRSRHRTPHAHRPQKAQQASPADAKHSEHRLPS